MGYKFSWSPIGAFTALLNDAKYLLDGKEKTINGKYLQYEAKELDINMALNLEGYPNRDSINYIKLYELNDATKVLRGTLRYRGFSVIINIWKELGLFNKDIVP